jgi:hypothetical protein
MQYVFYTLRGMVFVYGYKIQRFNHSRIQEFPAGMTVGSMHKTMPRAV